MDNEVIIRFRGDTSQLSGPLKQVKNELGTLGDYFDKLKNQGKQAYVENSRGATQLAQTLGTSLKNAKEFASAIGLSAQAATQAAQRLGELDRAGANTTQKYRALRSEFGLNRKAFDDLNASFNQNTRSQQQLAQTLGVNVAAARNLANGLGLSANRVNESVGRYRELSAVGATLAEKQRVLTQELGLSVEQFEKVRKVSLATREGLATLAGVAGGVAAALGAIGAKGTAAFAEFDSILRKFTVISGAGAAEVGKVRDEIERLGIASTKTPGEVADVAVELSKAGFTADQVAKSLNGIVLASQATGEDLGRTGEVVGNIINQFQLAAKDSTRIADLLVTTSNASAAGTNDLGEALAYVGTQAKQSNQSLEDTLQALGQLANSGIKGSAAGTGLAEALRRLKLASANASTELQELRTKGSKTAVAAFKQIEGAVRGANGELLPLPQILKGLEQGLATVAPADRDLINNALFGVQGGRVIQTLINGNAEQTNNLATALANAGGAAEKAGKQLAQGPKASLDRLQASTDLALIKIGELLSQAFLPMIDAAGALVNGFLSLPGPLQTAVVGIGSFAAAFASAVAAIAAYNLLNAKLIVQQTIASAAIVKDTAIKGLNTIATLNNAAAQGFLGKSYAALNTQVSLSAVATKAFTAAKVVATAAITAFTAVTSGQLVPALIQATKGLVGMGIAGVKSLVGLAAAAGPFLVAAAAIGGAIVLIQEAFIKTDSEKFTDSLSKSTDALRKLRGETVAAEPKVNELADAFEKFGQRVQQDGAIEAIRKTIADLAAELNRGADAASRFGEQSGFLTREQLGNQRAQIALTDRIGESNKVFDKGVEILTKYGLSQLDAGDKSRLGANGIRQFSAAAASQIKTIEAEIEVLQKLAEGTNDTQFRQQIEAQISLLNRSKAVLQSRAAALTDDANALKTNKDAAKETAKAQNEIEKAIKRVEDIAKQAEGGKLAADAAEKQLAEIVAAANNEISVRKAASDKVTQIRRNEIREIQDLISEGEISEAEGLQRLAAVQSGTNNTKSRREAAKAQVAIRKDQIDAEIATIQAGQAAIEAQIANGNTTEAEGERELTALKLQEIDKRIAAAQLEAENAVGSNKDKVLAEVKKLEADKLKLQADGQKKAQQQELDALKKAQDEAIALIQDSEQERLIAIQRQQNAGVLSQQQADKLRAESTRDRLSQELAAVQQQQAELEAIDTTGLGAEAAEQVENRKREARKQTTQLTLQLLQEEARAQKAAQDAVIEGIQRELAAQNRKYDIQLSRIADVQAAQSRASRDVEAQAQREAAAFEAAGNALARQNSLLQARGNLQQAQANLAQAETNIALDRVKTATQLRQELDNQNLSQQERIAIEQQIGQLGFRAGVSNLAFVREQQRLEEELSQQKLAALKQQQEQERASFDLEIQRNRIAEQRAITEARINQLKAQQAVLTAQTALEEQRANDARAIAAAESELAQARVTGDRDAIAAARTRLQLAEDAAQRGQENAEQGITLAQQQAELAAQATEEVAKSQQVSQQLETIARQTLDVQQQQATAQLEAAIAAERQARALELARAAVRDIAAANQPQTVEPRFAGGPVKPGQLYTMAERGPELIKFGGGKTALVSNPGLYQVPSSGVVYTADQTRRMMAGGVPRTPGSAPRRDPVVQEIQKTRRAIESRKAVPPAQITVASGDDRDVDRVMRAMIRSRW